MPMQCRPMSQVIEFFLSWPASGCTCRLPQQHYISANYTHATSYLPGAGTLNVVTQLVAKGALPRALRATA